MLIFEPLHNKSIRDHLGTLIANVVVCVASRNKKRKRQIPQQPYITKLTNAHTLKIQLSERNVGLEDLSNHCDTFIANPVRCCNMW